MNVLSKLGVIPYLTALVISVVVVSETTNNVESVKHPTGTETTAPSLGISNSQELREEIIFNRELMLLRIEKLLQSLEDVREEQKTATMNQSNVVHHRLDRIDDQLEATDERDRAVFQVGNRVLLWLIGLLIAFGFVALAGILALQTQALTRLAESMIEIKSANPASLEFSLPDSAGPVGAPLPNTIALLEKRIEELESSFQQDSKINALGAHVSAAAAESETTPLEANSMDSRHGDSEGEELKYLTEISALMGKGQTHLGLKQGEPALECFDSVLKIRPDHLEAILKKSKALEMLKRYDEAIEQYDHALKLDDGQTLAHLGKAMIFNLQERFEEALASYESALATQENRST